MADQNKFEQMLELLINEDKAAAEELFHEIVVEKSRDIYESLLEDEAEVDEADDEEVDEATDEEVDESDEDLDEDDSEEVEENFDMDSFEVEADDDMPAQDDTGDLMKDLGMDDEEGDMDDEGEEGDVEDRVEDLEDALDDLKAEFEKMMAGDDEGDDMDDMGDDEGEEEPEEAFAFEATDEEVEEAADEEVEEGAHKREVTADMEKMSKAEFAKKHGKEMADDMYEAEKSAGEQMREYVEKVSATMGDNGANTKSATAGKNDMGGTASNIAQSKDEKGVEANKGNLQGSALSDQNPKDMSTGNINVPGGKAGKAQKAMPKGHGADKKGAGENAENKKSVVGK